MYSLGLADDLLVITVPSHALRRPFACLLVGFGLFLFVVVFHISWGAEVMASHISSASRACLQGLVCATVVGNLITFNQQLLLPW